MLMLLFHLGNSRYAIPVAEVVEVAPWVELEPVARAPDYVAGLFNYRAQLAPVIDLCQMTQQRPCAHFFTTRIVIVNFPLADGGKRTLGLLAERVTETVELESGDFSPTGLRVAQTPWLDDATTTAKGVVQKIRVAQLLPEALQSQLFSLGEA